MSDDHEELELSLSLDDDLSLESTEPKMPPVASATNSTDPQMPELSLEPLDAPISKPNMQAAPTPSAASANPSAPAQQPEPVAPAPAQAAAPEVAAPAVNNTPSAAEPVTNQPVEQAVPSQAAENASGSEQTTADANLEDVAAANAAAAATKKTILAIKIKNKAALYGAYMPFLKGGGLFVPTRQKYNLGDLVNLRMELVEMHETIDVSGVVAWITPAAAQGNRAAGIGVQFTSENAVETVGKIERELAGLLMTDHPTHTM